MLVVQSAAVGEQLLALSDGEEDKEQLFLSSGDSDRGRRLPSRRLFAAALDMARDGIQQMQ